MALAPGTRLGPYEIKAPLGGDGMGEVYRARDTRLGRDVAWLNGKRLLEPLGDVPPIEYEDAYYHRQAAQTEVA